MISYWLLEYYVLLIRGTDRMEKNEGSIEIDENSFPAEISSILKIGHRTTNGVC